MSEQKKGGSELTWHWIITGFMLFMVIAYNIICHFAEPTISITLAEEQRILIRSIFYGISIFLFPLANLLRHILLKLNQTMPGDNSAKHRYLTTIIITLSLTCIIGIFGFIMFILGDGFNTLYIFSFLSILGIFLHKPKQKEYRQIIEALRVQRL